MLGVTHSIPGPAISAKLVVEADASQSEAPSSISLSRMGVVGALISADDMLLGLVLLRFTKVL